MFNNIKLRNSTTCDCGREFIISDIEKLERIHDKHFYSGIVKHYSKATCPICKKEVILLLKQEGQTYKVLNVAEKITETEPEDTIIENKEESTSSDEIICPECKKTFKSTSGLAVHLKTHQK